MDRTVLAIPGVRFTNIDERNNRLEVGVESLSLAAVVEPVLSAIGIPYNAVRFQDKQNVPAQSQQPTQTQLVGSAANLPADHPSSAKSDCNGKQKHAKQKHEQSDCDRDYQIPQNQVEYGGGG